MKKKEQENKKTEFEKDVEHVKKNLIWWRDWTNRDYLIVGWCAGILFAAFFWAVSIINFSVVDFCSENCQYVIDSADMVRVCNIYPKEFGNETLFLIGRAWDQDCFLAIGKDDHKLYWKCHGFAAPIRDLVCSETGENIQEIEVKKQTKEKIWWQRDCLDRTFNDTIQEKEECKNCEEWSDLILKEYLSYAYNLPGDVNLQVFKGEIRFGTPSENCKEIDNSVSCRIEYETLDGNIFSFNYNFRSLEYSKPMLLYDKYCLEVEE